MHISLDAALQRQPLLSTVGDKLLPSFPGAAAAYSLRALNGDANNVVNVRRDGDDGERDFTAEGVALELENWVNGKLETTLPADVATAAAAYSLRRVRNAYTGNAVQIRRDSDDVEVNVAFDSNGEVSDSSAISNVTESPDQGDTTATTLGEFLAEDISEYQNDSSWTGWNAFGNAAASTSGGAMTVTGATASGSDGVRYNTFLPSAGNRYRYEFTVSSLALDGATSFQLKGNANNIISSITATGSYSVEATVDSGGWGSFINFVLDGTASTGASITIDNLTITNIGHLATVVTWYDQSVNGYDATQDTTGSQPLIAENGSLVTDASGKPRLKIDGINDFFLLPSGFSVQTAVGVTEFDSTGTDFQGWAYLRDTTAPTNGNIRTNNTSPQTYRRDTTAEFVNNSSGDLFVNGVDTTSVSEDEKHLAFAVRQNAITLTTDNVAYPALFQGDSSRFMKGFGYEVILYSSDQSDNRFKIESNINNYYGIYNTGDQLTLPTAENLNGTLTNASSTGGTLSHTGTAYIGWELPEVLNTGARVFVSFDLTIDSGSADILIAGLTDTVSGSGRSASIDVNASGSYAFPLEVNADGATHFRFKSQTGTYQFTVSNLRIIEGGYNGFVETWYDQSGNGNDAEQASTGLQPRIVSNGSYLGELDFDGSDDELKTGSISGLIDNVSHSIFAVAKYNAATSNFEAFVSAGYGTTGTRIASVIGGDSSSRIWFGGDDQLTPTGGSITTNTLYLLTKTYDGATISGHVDGGAANTASAVFDLDADENVIAIGGYGTAATAKINGKVSEAIIYLSDQSANRTGIESNIADEYGITLS